MARPDPAVSVVIATFNRLARLERLLGQLADQTLSPTRYEVVVVDDGSSPPVAPALASAAHPYALRVEYQANAGAGVARHRGALAARGALVVFVDDDMRVGRGFVAAHLAAHPPGSRRAVLGRIRPPPAGEPMALSERWHQHHLDRLATRSARGERLPGNDLYSGNVSLRRSDYLEVGGFDRTFRQVEDCELGLRLEKAGIQLVVAEDAYTVNGADLPTPEAWRRRAFQWGIHDHRIETIHPELRHASAWRFAGGCHVASRPLLLLAALLPSAASRLADLAWKGAASLDRRGLERWAFTAVGLTFTLEYYRGLRAALGSAPAALAGAVEYFAGGPRRLGATRVAGRWVARRLRAVTEGA